MTIQDVVVVVVFLVLPLTAAGIFISRKLAELNSGDKVDKKDWLLLLGSLVFLSLVIHIGSFLSPFIPRRYLISLTLVTVAAFGGLSLKFATRCFRLKAEDIILEPGRVESKLTGLMAASFLALFGLYQATQVLDQGQINQIDLVATIIYFDLAFLYLAVPLSKVVFTRDGISRFTGTIKWENIKGYRWGVPERKYTPLTIKARLDITFNIPTAYQERVNEIFQGRVKPQEAVRDGEQVIQSRGVQ